jgi:hypothetical protein
MFDYVGRFQSAIVALKRERRYRVFDDLERKAGQCLCGLEQSGRQGGRRCMMLERLSMGHIRR